MYFCGALSIFYFAAACVAATSVSIDPGYGAGAVRKCFHQTKRMRDYFFNPFQINFTKINRIKN